MELAIENKNRAKNNGVGLKEVLVVGDPWLKKG